MVDASSRVLVVGAAGRYAGLVVPLLAERGVSVRGLVRSAEQGNTVIARGAAGYVIGDLRDVVSVKAALHDVDGVFYIAPFTRMTSRRSSVSRLSKRQRESAFGDSSSRP